jgi:S-disulfanyl-L-cysteine oxidoreductase SoxD
MFSCRERGGWSRATAVLRAMWVPPLLLLLLSLSLSLLLVSGVAQAQAQANVYSGVGRPATPLEMQAWDIDVRPDFKGLPKGSGSVAKGMEVWESKCASCHGVFGESNAFFSPIVGGTTKDDIQAGRVARLNDNSFPGRTTLMKLSNLSTLWDYINRAMPWNAPKSLTTDEVYAVTAYILNLGDVLPESFVLSDQNMAQAQALLPNRNGKTADHALWPGAAVKRLPDVVGTACMNNCTTEPKLASFLPDFARNAHGNLAEQNRTVGAQRGADTSKPAGATSAATTTSTATVGAAAAVAAAAQVADGGAATFASAQKHNCTLCHGVEAKIVGPSFRDIAKKYAGRTDAVAYLAGKVKSGGAGVWGAVAMPAQTLTEADAKLIAQWLSEGAKK